MRLAIWMAARPTLLEAAGISDRIALPQLGDVDERPVGGQILHPDRSRFFPRERGGVMRHGMDGGIRQVAVQAVLVLRKGRDGADRVPNLEALHAGPYGGDGPRRLVPKAGRQLGVFEVLAAAEHRLGAVQPQRLDGDLDLALARRRDFDVFDLEDFRAAGLVESHDARHDSLLFRRINFCCSPRRKARLTGEYCRRGGTLHDKRTMPAARMLSGFRAAHRRRRLRIPDFENDGLLSECSCHACSGHGGTGYPRRISITPDSITRPRPACHRPYLPP